MPIFPRLVAQYAFREDWTKTKMVFLAGPRQVGKTFIALERLKKASSLKLYYNWDLPETAQRYREDPFFFRIWRPWIKTQTSHDRL